MNTPPIFSGIPMFEVRRPSGQEVSALIDTFGRCLDAGFSVLPVEAHKAYRDAWQEEAVRERIASARDLLLIAVEGDRIVGLVSGTAPEGGVGTVVWLLTLPEWQGRGIGKSLFHAACDYYREVSAHKLKLTAPTEAAKSFYEKLGMQVEGFHPEHWWKADFWSLGLML